MQAARVAHTSTSLGEAVRNTPMMDRPGRTDVELKSPVDE
jgi:hypothetical protein